MPSGFQQQSAQLVSSGTAVILAILDRSPNLLPFDPDRVVFTFLPPYYLGSGSCFTYMEYAGVWSSPASPPAYYCPCHPRSLRGGTALVPWTLTRGAPAYVGASSWGSMSWCCRGKWRRTPFPTRAPGPRHARVLIFPILVGLGGWWAVSTSTSNPRDPGTEEILRLLDS